MLGGESGGGTNFNAVPAECWFTIDRRINPEESLAAEKTRLLDVLERCKQDAQGMPAFAYGPGLLSVAHGPNEYVDLRRIVDTATIYALTAIEMLAA
jgi:succinyl-diaminopimelate desuccinylase